jgi:O-antigen/teichoic acid export membrane protein
MVFPVCSFVMFNASRITGSWLGAGFAEAAGLVSVMVAGSMVNLLTGIGSSFVRGIGKPEMEMKYALLSAFLNGAYCLLFVKGYGAYGAAWAISAASIIASVYFLMYFHLTEGIINRDYVRNILSVPLAISVLCNLPVMLMNDHMWPGVFDSRSGLAVLAVEGLLLQLIVLLPFRKIAVPYVLRKD